MAERKLHANLNDTIVLMSRNRARKHLARFVDRTAQTETRFGRGYPVCRCSRSPHLGAAIILCGEHFSARLAVSAAMTCGGSRPPIAVDSDSRHAQTLERGASRSSTDVRHDDQFKNGDIRKFNMIFLDLA